jgi:hypothetical protein
MTRVKKVVGLPQRYWDEIDKRVDGELIRSYGDALISILNDTYPHIKTQPEHQHHTSAPSVQYQPKKPNFSFDCSPKTPVFSFDDPAPRKQNNNINIKPVLCECGHVIEGHSDAGCLANGGMCECKKYEPAAPA